MSNYTVTAADYERLQALLQAAQAAYDSALLLRSQGIVISKTDIAMAALKGALDNAAGVTFTEVKTDANADKRRTRTTPKRHNRATP
jgi:hypothetical protein